MLLISAGFFITGCAQPEKNIRVATFNIWELSTEKLNDVNAVGTGQHEQVLAARDIIQQVRPDILVLNEIDHDYAFPNDLARNVRQFRSAYLEGGKNPIDYPHLYVAACNTGIRTGLDLDGDGIVADSSHVGTRVHGNDCFGYGSYPGQYSMALLSKYPIDTSQVRTFQKFLWKDLSGNHIPADYYPPEVIDIFRLSSKSHWDVPVQIKGKTVHLLLSHPTPPVFDGPEDRNGRRNFDEIKFWVHYLANDPLLYDDIGTPGGYKADEPFLIAGDLNASPIAEKDYENISAINQLLNNPKIQDTGSVLAAPPHNPDGFTAQFSRGNKTRIDYLLPGTDVTVVRGGIFWPAETEYPDGFVLAKKASDHRLVWLDIVLPD